MSTSRSQENSNALQPLVSVAEYRKVLKDTESTDFEIVERLRYIESLCRAIIKAELENYVAQENT
jgi:hypothetical protein